MTEHEEFLTKLKVLIYREHFPGKSVDGKLDEIETKEGPIHVATTYEQIQNLNGGVLKEDTKLILQSMIIDETISFIKRKVSKYLFEHYMQPIEDDRFHKRLIDIFSMYSMTDGFVITNGAVGASIQDLPRFQTMPLNKITNISGGNTYKIGSIDNLAIYVDPFKIWDDTTMSIVFNKFYNFSFVDKKEDIVVMSPNVAPKVNPFDVHIAFGKLDSVGFKVENIYL